MTESARDVMLHAWERHLTSVLDGEVVPGNAVDAMLTALRSAGYDPDHRREDATIPESESSLGPSLPAAGACFGVVERPSGAFASSVHDATEAVVLAPLGPNESVSPGQGGYPPGRGFG